MSKNIAFEEDERLTFTTNLFKRQQVWNTPLYTFLAGNIDLFTVDWNCIYA